MNHIMVSSVSQSNYVQSSLPMTLQPCSYLGFHPHFPKLSCSLKTKPIKASVHSLYAATESFYDLLGIPVRATPREIKQTYKQLVLKYHPDVSPPELIEDNKKKFIQLQEAYETLSDPKSRASYDCDLTTGSLMTFSTGKPYNEDSDDKLKWKIQWQSQLTELKRKSMNKGARICRQRSKTTMI